MEARLDGLAPADARRHFHTTYLRTTHAVEEEMRRDRFVDPAWVQGVLVFLWLTLLASLLHLSTFHLTGSGPAAVAAYAWLAIYAVDPPLLTVAVWRQLSRAPTPRARLRCRAGTAQLPSSRAR